MTGEAQMSYQPKSAFPNRAVNLQGSESELSRASSIELAKTYVDEELGEMSAVIDVLEKKLATALVPANPVTGVSGGGGGGSGSPRSSMQCELLATRDNAKALRHRLHDLIARIDL